jgi:hypothetical protein
MAENSEKSLNSKRPIRREMPEAMKLSTPETTACTDPETVILNKDN